MQMQRSELLSYLYFRSKLRLKMECRWEEPIDIWQIHSWLTSLAEHMKAIMTHRQDLKCQYWNNGTYKDLLS